MIEQLFDIWLYGLVPVFLVLVTLAGNKLAKCGTHVPTRMIVLDTLCWPWLVVDLIVIVAIDLISKAFQYWRA